MLCALINKSTAEEQSVRELSYHVAELVKNQFNEVRVSAKAVRGETAYEF